MHLGKHGIVDFLYIFGWMNVICSGVEYLLLNILQYLANTDEV